MLKQFPLLRILVPFICGIVVCYKWDCSEVFIASIFAAAVLSAIALNIMSRFPRSENFFGHKQPANFRRKPSTVMKLRGWQILPIVLLSAALGMLCLSLSRPSVLPTDCFGKMAAARVTSIIHKNSSMSMDAEITQIKGFQVSNKHKIKLSIAQNDYSLRENCIIAFRLNPETITENSNPGDFNYGRYLFLKGFLYSQFIKKGEYKIIGRQSGLSTMLADLRRNISISILDSRISEDAKSQLIAMLLGDSEYIDRSTRDSYSNVGVSHILALSGLHIGIISFIIWFLLYPLDYILMRRLRLGITIGVIIFYAIFTGLSVSIMRSSLMIVFATLAFVFNMKNNSLNALFFAAFIILVISPMSLFDIGFQLSFSAVLSLVVLALYLPVSPKINPVLRYLLSLILTSLTTSIATLPLTAFYFHKISFCAPIANLFVIPLLPFFMVSGIFMILATALGINLPAAMTATTFFHKLINSVIGFFNSIPNAFANNVYISDLALALLIAAVIALAIAAIRRNLISLCSAGTLCVLSYSASSFAVASKSGECLFVFSDYKFTPIVYLCNHNCLVWSPGDSISEDYCKSRFAGFIAEYQVDSITILPQSGWSRDGNFVNYPYAMLMGKSIAVANSKSLKFSPRKIDIDIAIIDKRFRKSISDISKKYNTENIVISGNTFSDMAKQLITECDSCRINCHYIKNSPFALPK